ncbi:short chain dehydrogenase yanD [Lipomyces doorenjongii]
MADAITSVPAKNSLGSLWWSARHPPADPTTSFTGQIILITGANSGLDFEAAIKFAALGAKKLILAVRSLERGKKAKARIEQHTRCSKDVIEVLQLDMASYSSVESFTQELSRRFPVVHAAVLNAGVALPSHKASSEGWEMALQVNVLSTAYLGILLLPLLRQSFRSIGRATHLEFVTSTGHGDVKIASVQGGSSILDKVNNPENFNFTTQYIITKLLEMWVMMQIAAATSSSQVIVNASCPGLCKSSLGRHFSLALRVPDNIMKAILGRSAEEGSRTLVSAVTTDEKAHGGFWTHDRIAVPGVLTTTEEGKELNSQFWKEAIEVLSKQNPKIESILTGSS